MTFSAIEEAELRVLAAQAFDLRDSPFFDDALAAIDDWWERLPERRAERLLADLEAAP